MHQLTVLLLLFLAASSILGVSCNNISDFADCAFRMNTLERALYTTGDNLLDLHRSFYPPGLRPSRFIRVTYSFLDETGQENGCNVSYVWATGEIFFIQPPRLFLLNTLFFNYPNNNLTDLELTLPSECRPLIQANESDTECSCLQDSRRLSALTEELNIYAKFSSPDRISMAENFAKAVCTEDLQTVYYGPNNRTLNVLLICFAVVIPISCLIAIVSWFRKMDEKSITSFTDPTKHGTIVALIFTGAAISIGILLSDIIACTVVVYKRHEFSTDISGRPFSLYVIFVATLWNIVFVSALVLSMLYVNICFNGRKFFAKLGCSRIPFDRTLTSLLVRIVGRSTYDKIGERSKNPSITVLLLLMTTVPLLCVSPHLGYIAVAWLTESSKCNTVFVLYYAFLIYLFFTFRKFYNVHSKIEFACGRPKKRVGASARVLEEGNDDIELDDLTGSATRVHDTQSQDGHFCCLSSSHSDDGEVNTHAFCLLSFYSPFIIGIGTMVVLVFLLLPLAAEDFVTYFSKLIHLIVVFVSTQLAYILYFGSGDGLEKVKSLFSKKAEKDDSDTEDSKMDEKIKSLFSKYGEKGDSDTEDSKMGEKIKSLFSKKAEKDDSDTEDSKVDEN